MRDSSRNGATPLGARQERSHEHVVLTTHLTTTKPKLERLRPVGGVTDAQVDDGSQQSGRTSQNEGSNAVDDVGM
jgi:hypothetical protein